MPKITLLDGTIKNYNDPITPIEIASEISISLSKKVFFAIVNNKQWDKTRPIVDDSLLKLITKKDKDDALEILRHGCAHILAEAVLELYPETQVTIGPPIKDGFYYDFYREKSFNTDDLIKIEQKMHEIVDRDEKIERGEWNKEEAVEFYSKKQEPFKVELVKDIPDDEIISFYKQGDFIDLCRGPHLSSTKETGHAFKLMKVAGAYWRGNSKNQMLQRIYGTAWFNEKELSNYLHMIEEAEKRDHRKLGKELDFFHLQDSAVGSVFWHSKGWIIYREIENYMRRKLYEQKYIEVKTPQLIDRSLWEDSGHWDKFREHMFTALAEDEKILALKPMNCPGHVQIYKQGIKSYRDLPLRMAEFGSCHRNEPSGALHGIMRVRAFTQDDAHIFCTEDQINEETVKFCNLLQNIYEDFGFKEIIVKFSDRPEIRSGSDNIWNKAETALLEATKKAELKVIENPGEGAFYGPKLEFVIKDAIGRDWQCGTLQVDFVLPERLNAEYVDEHGNRKRPVMLHRAVLGSFERWIGILIEQYSGRLPAWISPVQAVVIPITDKNNQYAKNVHKLFKEKGFRIDLDIRNEKIGYKIREHSTLKVPYIFVVGMKEQEEKTVALRRLGSNDQINMLLDKAISELSEEILPPDKR